MNTTAPVGRDRRAVSRNRLDDRVDVLAAFPLAGGVRAEDVVAAQLPEVRGPDRMPAWPGKPVPDTAGTVARRGGQGPGAAAPRGSGSSSRGDDEPDLPRVSIRRGLVRRRGMSEPVKTKNLDDQYGSAALPWSRARDLLATQTPHENLTFFVGTVRPDGRPHAAGVGAIWVDDALWFVSGPRTRRARNLAANPACTVSVRLKDIDLTMEGEAHRVTDPAALERVAAVYREGGWPATVDGDAFTAPFSAPSAGPAPWHLYRLTLHRAYGVASAEPHGAGRWDFTR